jgi:phosphatidylglycerol---prolipoprotein diacylglyceryl transferase
MDVDLTGGAQSKEECNAMIPYWDEPSLRVGPLTLYAFGALLVCGLILGSCVFLSAAKHAGLSQRTACSLLVIFVPVAFIGSHLWYCATQDESALLVFGGISSFGGIVASILTFLIVVTLNRAWRAQWLAWLDIGMYAFAFAALVSRLGCFLAHDHAGLRTSGWLSVEYPGGPRVDLALLEFIFWCMYCALLSLIRRPKKQGMHGMTFGVSAVIYGLFRGAVDNLRDRPARFAGLTADQYAALALLTAGLVVSLTVFSRMSDAESLRSANKARSETS